MSVHVDQIPIPAVAGERPRLIPPQRKNELLFDLLHGVSHDKQALQLALARLEFGRPFFMPPGVAADRVNAIRRAFDAATKDKEMLAEANKLKIEVDPLSGEQVASLIADIYKTPAETVERVRAAMAPK